MVLALQHALLMIFFKHVQNSDGKNKRRKNICILNNEIEYKETNG